MPANAKATSAVMNRRESIKTKLTKNPGVIFSYKDFENEFGVSKWTIRTDLFQLMADDSNVNMAGGKIYYNVKETPIIHEVKKPERYSIMQNIDGLSDPTVGTVLNKLEPESKGMIFPRPGDVWNTTRCAGKPDTDLYIVLAVNKEKQTAACIKYAKEDQAETCDISVYTKPLKYFVGNERSWGMPLSFLTRVRERIGEFLDIPTKVTREVEIVEKEIPVPIADKKANVSNGMYTKEQVDLMLAEQKAKIYEECFMAVTMK